MRNRLTLISITVKSSALLFFVPLFVAYLVLPFFYTSLSNIDDKEYVVQRLYYIAQTLIPVCSILWPMAYLQILIDSDGQETMRACKHGRYTCVWELVLLELILLFTLAPMAGVSINLFGLRVGEFIRLLSQISFAYGLLYFTSILLQSVSMAGMIIVSYLLFSVIFSESEALSKICIINNSLVTIDDIMMRYVPAFILAIIFYALGNFFEKRYFPK